MTASCRMRLSACVLLHLACAGQGRQTLASQEEVHGSSGKGDDRSNLAGFLLALNPQGAQTPQAAHRSTTNPRNGARLSKVRMQGVVDPPEKEFVGIRDDSGMSYRKQYLDLFSRPLQVNKPVPKPSPEAQASEPTAKKVKFSKDVYGTKMGSRFFNRKWTKRDIGRAVFFTAIHALGAMAPFYFTTRMALTQFIIYCFSALGITYSYHRQLSHKSFKSPKWFEYFWATWGMMGMQGAPLDWASEHRYHHVHCETPLEPHSIYEGFYWAHVGWLLDSEKKEERCADMSNALDMSKQKFYQITSKYYKLFVLAHWALFYAVGGMAGVAWRAFWVAVQYHVTWFVNSASHVWGNKKYTTGDQSRNNWWVGILAFGEGWHNNHHAFEYSARHGLERHQLDMTWMLISLFKKLGLVSNVKLPTERNLERLRIKKEQN